jgi:phosphoribosyl 1,2-cyclic phosphodiesterase
LTVRIRFFGSGNAFADGGRSHACIHVSAPGASLLLDCGGSALPALTRADAADTIDAIAVSHLHGDHFGGIPYLILDGQLVSKRTKPLVLAGPAGLETRWNILTEVSFPGATAVKRQFAIETRELAPGAVHDFGVVQIEPFPVVHMPHDPCFAYRITVDGRSIAYTGDSEWTDSIIAAGRDADLLIAEAYYRDKKIKNHLDFATLAARGDQVVNICALARQQRQDPAGEHGLVVGMSKHCQDNQGGMIVHRTPSNSERSKTGPSLQASFQPERVRTAQTPHSATLPHGSGGWIKACPGQGKLFLPMDANKASIQESIVSAGRVGKKKSTAA